MDNSRSHRTSYAAHKEDVGGCGLVAIADTHGRFSPEIVKMGLKGLDIVSHRGGAFIAEGETQPDADGSGILMNFQREFVAQHLSSDQHIPESEEASIGMLFLPRDREKECSLFINQVRQNIEQAGLCYLGMREVPTDASVLGRDGRETAPYVAQFFAGEGRHHEKSALNQAIWGVKQRLKNMWTQSAHNGSEFPILASFGNTMVYKVLGTPSQLEHFYFQDLKDPPASSIAIAHVRHATNTISCWGNVQPFNNCMENGEINSIAGNREEMRRLEKELGISGTSISILSAGASDTRDFDAFLSYLIESEGVPIEEALRRMVPPTWWSNRDFTLEMRQWFERNKRHLGSLGVSGPNFILGTDGIKLVGVWDEMGYRKGNLKLTRDGNLKLTRDGILMVASGMGALPVDFSTIEATGQGSAGDIFMLDTKTHEFLIPREVHQRLLSDSVLDRKWGYESKPIVLSPDAGVFIESPSKLCEKLNPAQLFQFGWTKNDLDYVKMWLTGEKEPRSSMGRDWPPAVFSKNHLPLTAYALPVCASCTNPANDPELEGDAIDTRVYLGNPNLKPYHLPVPILSPSQLGFIQDNRLEEQPRSATFDCVLKTDNGFDQTDAVRGGNLIGERIDEIVVSALEAVREKNVSIIVLSHNHVDGESSLPIPGFLLVSAIKHALASHGLQASIVMESSEIKDRHDMMVYFQCGADAICPTAIWAKAHELSIPNKTVFMKLRDGLIKEMSLPGITTFQAYRGAKLLEFIGFGSELMQYLPGIDSKLGGIGLAQVYEDMIARRDQGLTLRKLPAWDEPRRLSPKVAKKLFQKLAKSGNFEDYKVLEQDIRSRGEFLLSDCLEIIPAGHSIPLEEVISEEEIVRQFFSGAHVSYGATGLAAHMTNAEFWNEMGCFSGSGEGGEIPERSTGGMFESCMSRDREFASARFGVDINYVADPRIKIITIKIHQGAKANEGADVPPKKNTFDIARTRHTKPGTRLRSPVTNLDLFSIEDFGQLVTILHEANPTASICVKYVSGGSEAIPIGVIKSMCHELLVSGGEGGTGSATEKAIATTGYPREIGLAATHRAIVEYGLEDEIKLGVDGAMLLAHDVLISNAMGAQRVSFGGAWMQALGCLMLRRCHLGECDPGIATQDEKLLKNFLSLGADSKENLDLPDESKREIGKKRLRNYFVNGLAHAVRLECARLGVRSPAELVGRVDLLRQRKTRNPRIDKLDLSYLIERPGLYPEKVQERVRRKVYRVDTTRRNREIVQEVEKRLAAGERDIVLELDNLGDGDQGIGTRLAGEMVRNKEQYQGAQVTLRVRGEPGFGCFMLLHPGMNGYLEGYSGDDFGASCMDGAKIVARPPREVKTEHGADSVIGNNGFYAATGGEGYVRGGAGERFAVRFSGGRVVHEGSTGKYPYMMMTNGVAIHFGGLLGESPFSGMTGGKVYTTDYQDLANQCAHGSVLIRHGLDPEEEEEIKQGLRDHARETESSKAFEILENWDFWKDQWAVITPNPKQASSHAGIMYDLEFEMVA